MTTLEVLEKARGVIAPRGNWIKGWGWWDEKVEDGETCAVGAVRVALGIPIHSDCQSLAGSPEGTKAARKLAAVIDGKSVCDVINYNDSHTHECVLAMYDAAIEKEREKNNHA